MEEKPVFIEYYRTKFRIWIPYYQKKLQKNTWLIHFVTDFAGRRSHGDTLSNPNSAPSGRLTEATTTTAVTKSASASAPAPANSSARRWRRRWRLRRRWRWRRGGGRYGLVIRIHKKVGSRIRCWTKIFLNKKQDKTKANRLFIEIGAVDPKSFWIRIRIRIQHFKWIRIQGFDDQILKKIIQGPIE